MTWPYYVTTRPVSAGAGFAIEDGAPLKVKVEVKADRSLIHDVTGERFRASMKPFTSLVGEKVVFPLPVTDESGWRDEDSGALIDVSAENSYTHRYTVTLTLLDDKGRQVGAPKQIGPFIVPTADLSEIDIDKLLPVSSVPGGQVSIPDVWSELVAEAQAASTAAAGYASAAAASAEEALEEIAPVAAKATALETLTTTGRLGEAELSATFVSSFIVAGPGIDPTGATDSSAAIQAILTAAGAVKGRVIFPRGKYLCDNLSIPAYVTVEGFAGGQYRFGAGAAADGGTVLLHKAGATNPLVIINGGAVTVRNVLLHGNDAPGTGLRIAHGFEARLDTVRVAYVAGCGIDIDGSCNTSYRDVFVDNCGSATEPLVKLNAIFPRTTNTVDFTGLTIERGTHPAASYLTIGDYLDATNNDYPEFIRIINAHIEAPTDNGGVAPTAPLVKIVNARNVDFVEPFIYGGPGPMIEHARTDTNLATALGGIRILGGTLLGRLASTGNQPANLVKLTSGDLFSMVGTRVEEFSGAAVLIAATYGRNVYIDPTVQTSKARTTLFSDSRPNRNPFFFAGDIQATGADSKINLSADSCPFVPGNYYAGRGVSVTTYQTAQGVMRLSMLHVGRNCTINEIGVEVTTAGSAGALLRLGIYRINKWVEGTAELLVDAGTVDASSAGYKSITIGQYVPVGETLLLAVVAQGAPATLPIVRGTSGTIPAIGATAPLTVSQAGIVGSGQNGVTDALPASHTISAAGTVPRALVKGA